MFKTISSNDGPALSEQDFMKESMCLASATDEEFSAGFFALIADVERDFSTEEQLMEAIGFPAIKGHVEQHARILRALHHAAPRVMEGNIALGREVVELLPLWFVFHQSTMDTELAVAIQMACDQEDLSAISAPAELFAS